MSARPWDDIVPAAERRLYAASGLGQRSGLGRRPALLVVDVTYEFTGDRPEPAIESIKRFPLSCGEAAWVALPRIRALLDRARELGVPVFYTRQAPRDTRVAAGLWAAKNARIFEATSGGDTAIDVHDIPTIIAPLPGERVIDKDKPSAFFGTPLISYLVALGVDSLIIAGTSTSGCVRATVVDAFSLNYPTVVAEDGSFDRISASHKVNLFDMDSKYADVLPVADILGLLDGLSEAAAAPLRAAVGG
jgi:nicotinamidase-related amidase